MNFRCEICGQKLKGQENFCPSCAQKITYECEVCGKIMDNGKYRYCPLCRTERTEKRNGIL